MEEKKRYFISIDGCDDSTAFIMELTEAELKVLKAMAAKAEETSTSFCMPTINITDAQS